MCSIALCCCSKECQHYRQLQKRSRSLATCLTASGTPAARAEFHLTNKSSISLLFTSAAAALMCKLDVWSFEVSTTCTGMLVVGNVIEIASTPSIMQVAIMHHNCVREAQFVYVDSPSYPKFKSPAQLGQGSCLPATARAGQRVWGRDRIDE